MSKRCPYCREYIQDKAVKCRYCGKSLGDSTYTQHTAGTDASWQHEYETGKNDITLHPITGEPLRPRPGNNLVWAILATIFCCMPFGVVSIVYAAKVDEAYNTGFIEESYRVSKKAETWAIVSMVTGIAGGIIYAIIFTMGFARI